MGDNEHILAYPSLYGEVEKNIPQESSNQLYGHGITGFAGWEE